MLLLAPFGRSAAIRILWLNYGLINGVPLYYSAKLDQAWQL